MTPHQANYFAHELSRRGPSGSVEKIAGALADAKVDLNPHQVEAALFAFKSPLSRGAILADEVGLGKTIEAGILLSQFWAEKRQRILLIMPASLRKQWSIELAEKFYLPSVILEARNFNQAIKAGEKNPFERSEPEIVICSFQFAANKEDYLVGVPWDLVVIDEAHRLRNVYKPASKTANKLKSALHGMRKVLLTATPLQNSLMELYGLVSLIDEYAFGDPKSFSAQFSRLDATRGFAELKERLRPLCHRTLRHQVTEFVQYTNRISLTQPFDPGAEEEKLYELVSEYLQRDQLHALPKAQRTLMTLIYRKLLASSTYAIAGALDSLVRKLNASLRDDEKLRENAEEDLENDLDCGFDELSDEWGEEETVALTAGERLSIEDEIAELEQFRDLAVGISENAKGEALLIALEKGFVSMQENGAEKKAIIFTESRRTQDYLLRRLASTPYADKIVLFNGSNSDAKSKEIYSEWKEKNAGTDRVTGSRTADIRLALVDYFKNEAKIMIATEAAAEGINLQFCSLVVNYDLPWNPQRIEQRIGRCHRYGQKHDVVVINFLNRKNEADQRVFELLSEKFNLFSGVFGASDEVIGSIESGVDFEKRIVSIYQRCRNAEEIKASFDALQSELEDSINAKMNETRSKLLENFDAAVADKLRTNQTKSREFLSRVEQILWRLTRHILDDRAFFPGDEHAFVLANPPYQSANENRIPLGRYELTREEEHAHRYRLHHPLARAVIDEARQFECGPATIRFDYSSTPGQSVDLAPLVGQSGTLRAAWLSVQTGGDGEDHLLLAGFTDGGESLNEDQCHRILDLPGRLATAGGPDSTQENHAKHAVETSRARTLEEIAARHAAAFEQEIDKLEHWAEDRKASLELELKELDTKIREAKKESKVVSALDEKVKWQQTVRKLERQRAERRRDIFEAQDAVEDKRDELLEDAETRLTKHLDEYPLFSIRWEVV
ncbi:SNF2-related protein [Verrucomicrobiales bacterium BCK34]|nr:SNF2-related protein [Verrucomicrobiales bacterium BCK34]